MAFVDPDDLPGGPPGGWQVSPSVQNERDRRALALKREEREQFPNDPNLAREITRDENRLGAVSGFVDPDDTPSTARPSQVDVRRAERGVYAPSATRGQVIDAERKAMLDEQERIANARMTRPALSLGPIGIGQGWGGYTPEEQARLDELTAQREQLARDRVRATGEIQYDESLKYNATKLVAMLAGFAYGGPMGATVLEGGVRAAAIQDELDKAIQRGDITEEQAADIFTRELASGMTQDALFNFGPGIVMKVLGRVPGLRGVAEKVIGKIGEAGKSAGFRLGAGTDEAIINAAAERAAERAPRVMPSEDVLVPSEYALERIVAERGAPREFTEEAQQKTAHLRMHADVTKEYADPRRYVGAPSESGKPLYAPSRAAELGAGKTGTERELSIVNQKTTQQFAADSVNEVLRLVNPKALPLSPGKITPAELKRLSGVAGEAYEAVKRIPGKVRADDDFVTALAQIDDELRAVLKDFPGARVSPQAKSVVNSALEHEFSPAGIVEYAKRLRSDAAANFRKGGPNELQLSAAQRKVATSLEDLLERSVGKTNPTLLDSYQAARKLRARVGNVEEALVEGTGEVSAAAIAAARKGGAFLDDKLAAIADAAERLPRATRLPSKLPLSEGVGLREGVLAGVGFLVTGSPLGLVAALARPAGTKGLAWWLHSAAKAGAISRAEIAALQKLLDRNNPVMTTLRKAGPAAAAKLIGPEALAAWEKVQQFATADNETTAE